MISFKQAAVGLVAAAVALSAQARPPYVVGKNVQVSLPFPGAQHYETQVAADPEDASHLLIGAYIVNGDGSIDNVFYVSFDGGRS